MGRAHVAESDPIGVVLVTICAALLMAGLLTVLLAPHPARHRLDLILADHRSDTSPEPRSEPPRFSSPRARVAASVLAGLGVTTLFGGWFAPIAGIIAAIGAYVVLKRSATPRAVSQSAVGTALAADLLLAGIRAGCSPVTAAEIVGAALGGSLGGALIADGCAARLGACENSWQELHRVRSWRPLGRALRASLAHGMSPAPALKRAARDARDGARWDGEAKARSVGARAAAPLGLCFLPAFVLVAIVPIVATSF